MVKFRSLSALFLLLTLGGCALAPGQHIPDSNLEYETHGGWQVRGRTIVYGSEPIQPEPTFKVTTIDASVVAAQERDRLKLQREVSGAKRPDELQYYEYRVGPQDVLSFTVWDHPELTSPSAAANAAFTAAVSPLGAAATQTVPTDTIGHHVTRDGKIFFPYIGEVMVAGLTLEEIRGKIAAGLSAYIPKPQVDVRVVSYRSKKVYVTGEVKAPCTIPIADTPSLWRTPSRPPRAIRLMRTYIR